MLSHRLLSLFSSLGFNLHSELMLSQFFPNILSISCHTRVSSDEILACLIVSWHPLPMETNAQNAVVELFSHGAIYPYIDKIKITLYFIIQDLQAQLKDSAPSSKHVRQSSSAAKTIH